MNAKTLKALRGSVRKWKLIKAGKLRDKSWENCPLCKLFIDDHCVGCPVEKRTHDEGCGGTPYEKWRIECGIGKTADTPKLKQLANAELVFLKSLLPLKRQRNRI